MTKPWERQQSGKQVESKEAWEAFQTYLKMPAADRNYAAVGVRLGKSRRLMYRWAARWQWETRVIAWDNYLDQVAKKETEKEVKAMVKKHLNIATLVQGISISVLQGLADKVKAKQPIDLSPKDALALVDWGVKMERMCYDAPTELLGGNLNHTVAGKIRFINVKEQRREEEESLNTE